MKKAIICFIIIVVMAGLCFAPIRRRIIFPVENRKFYLHDLEAFSGNVIGPVSATDHAIARWDGTDGLTIQGSAVSMDDNGNITIPDGITIGQAAGPLLAFDDTLNYLEITGCNVGIGTTAPTGKLDINDDSVRIRTAKTPSSTNDTGTTGQIAWDASYLYVCTSTDNWERVALAEWGLDYLLLETGDKILLETGDKLYLE